MAYKDSEMPAGAGKSAISRMSFITVLIFVAAAPVSCASVSEDLFSSASPVDSESTTTVNVARTHKSYAYQAPDIAPVAFTPQKTISSTEKPGALGSSTYICSPSGFGQIARCILR